MPLLAMVIKQKIQIMNNNIDSQLTELESIFLNEKISSIQQTGWIWPLSFIKGKSVLLQNHYHNQ